MRLGDFEIIEAGRELLMHGEMLKISRNEARNMPAYLILLSDCLLYTSYAGAWIDENTALKVKYDMGRHQKKKRQKLHTLCEVGGGLAKFGV